MVTDLVYMLHLLRCRFNLFMSCCCNLCCCFVLVVVVLVVVVVVFIVVVICCFFVICCYLLLFVCLCVAAIVVGVVVADVVEILIKLMFSVYAMILQVSRGCRLQSARHSAWRYLGFLRISSATSCASADHAQKAT